MLVELDGLVVFQLRVGKQARQHVGGIFSGDDLQDGLGGDALVNVQRHRIYGETLGLLLDSPLQPGLMRSESVGQNLDLCICKGTLFGNGQQLRELVSTACVIEAQTGWQMRTVGIHNLGRAFHHSLCRQPGRRVVLARRRKPSSSQRAPNAPPTLQRKLFGSEITLIYIPTPTHAGGHDTLVQRSA
jgi:hypothetical protein